MHSRCEITDERITGVDHIAKAYDYYARKRTYEYRLPKISTCTEAHAATGEKELPARLGESFEHILLYPYAASERLVKRDEIARNFSTAHDERLGERE